jgi:hypothetical protein
MLPWLIKIKQYEEALALAMGSADIVRWVKSN